MKTTCAILAMASAATAFAPSQVAQTSTTALNGAFDNEVGAASPWGAETWDPLNFVANGDQARFDRLRYVELKHGRIAQLAFLGQITTRAGYHLPGNIFLDGTKFSEIGNGYAGLMQCGTKSIAQIVFFIGILELTVMKDQANGAKPGEFPGDFRNGGGYGWDKWDEETKKSKRAIELNNGRAAQMGILGLMIHEQLGSNMPLIGQL